MTHTPFPTAATWPLPAAALRAPLPARAEDKPTPEVAHVDKKATDDLAQQVSETIARRARQRRYTG